MRRYLIEQHATWEVTADGPQHAIDLAQATPPDTVDTHVEAIGELDKGKG